MINNCKEKGCSNEALNRGRYCNYHQSKRENNKKILTNGVGFLASLVITIVLNKRGKK